MPKIKIKEGPHGLFTIDVYEPLDAERGYTYPFTLAVNVDNKLMRVEDAETEKVSDAYFNGTEEERGAAAQWLLDFTYITADGR